MIIADLAEIAGRTYPARRRTQNLVGGASPIQAKNFSMGCVTLEPHGGQVPWHNQEQEEIYLILEGDGEMCLGAEKSRSQGRSSRLHSLPSFSPTHQHRRHSHAHDLLLRSRRRRGALAPGIGWHTAPRGRGRSGAPLGRAAPQCTEEDHKA